MATSPLSPRSSAGWYRFKFTKSGYEPMFRYMYHDSYSESCQQYDCQTDEWVDGACTSFEEVAMHPTSSSLYELVPDIFVDPRDLDENRFQCVQMQSLYNPTDTKVDKVGLRVSTGVANVGNGKFEIEQNSNGVFCVTPCQANADCPSGELCRYSVFDADASNGCQPGNCPIPSCDESTSRCFVRAADGMEFCEPKYCETSDDCEHDCIVSPGSQRPGQCLETDTPNDLPDCKPNEYKLYRDDPYCRLPGPCWDAAICQNNGQPCDDCPTGYECLRPDPNKASRATFAFCSRLLPTD